MVFTDKYKTVLQVIVERSFFLINKGENVQTFLPHIDFRKSAAVLDDKRLCKQITEAFQILDTMDKIDSSGNFKADKVAWGHHPAVLMWLGNEMALKCYITHCMREWVCFRGKNYKRNSPCVNICIEPDWLTEKFCIAHRSNLLRKDPEFYKKYNWNISHDLPYMWPVRWKNGQSTKGKA